MPPDSGSCRSRAGDATGTTFDRPRNRRAGGRLVGPDMETMTLHLADDDFDVQRAGHQLFVWYGSRAAEIARARARCAGNVNDEQAWLDIAKAIARER